LVTSTSYRCFLRGDSSRKEDARTKHAIQRQHRKLAWCHRDDEQANKGEMDGSGRERTDLVRLVPTCDSVSTDRRMDAIRSSSYHLAARGEVPVPAGPSPLKRTNEPTKSA
jgi:hypothetical protein